MTDIQITQTPHRRYNPLNDEWVLVSPQRTSRPWLGQIEPSTPHRSPAFDPNCYLCPGTSRAAGSVNDSYTGTYVFTNDYPALKPMASTPRAEVAGLLRSEPEAGTCRVLCFSPRHDVTLATMDRHAVEAVVDMWAAESEELGRTYASVQVFENRGDAMGASNPHPHGQIWAQDSVPTVVSTEDRQQATHRNDTGNVLLLDYAGAEKTGERAIVENHHWLIVVPYWAVWPFESIILPRRHVQRMPDLTAPERTSLAAALQELLIRYENLFEAPFPYSMGWHGAPFRPGTSDHWQFHGHVLPPLLRSSSVRKFMVGYELLGEPQRDLTPEEAAARLREVPSIHYLTDATV